MEKLIKTRVKDVLDTINPLQCGGRCNRSTCDCTFILRCLIDHAKYLNRTLYLTLYDYQTCFDSLWLEDCIISLWNLGINNQMLPLIYKMNESSRVIVKSPYGPTRPFNCPRIVKQGTVLGSTLCGSTTAELCGELKQGGASVLSESVKGLLFVDDTITANHTFNDTIQSNNKVVLFSKRKRVEFNVPKCFQLIINYKDKTPCPILFIDEEEIARVQSTRYLGDIFSDSGTNKDLIEDRVKKGKTTTISIMAMCTTITLGLYRIRITLLLYEVVYLAAVLFNSQAWSNITITEYNQLQTSQLKFLKRTMQVPSSTPNAFTYLELGVIPIRYKIHKRQLNFLHHIIHLPSSDPVHKLHLQQKLLPYEKNWTNNVFVLLQKYELDYDSIKDVSKEAWKETVEEAITTVAFQELIQQCSEKTKTFRLKYECFQRQKYITTFPADLACLLFRIRGKVINCRDNHHSSHQSIICRLCGVTVETQEHIANCPKVRGDREVISFEQFYAADIDGNSDLTDLVDVKNRYRLFQDLVSGTQEVVEDTMDFVHT